MGHSVQRMKGHRGTKLPDVTGPIWSGLFLIPGRGLWLLVPLFLLILIGCAAGPKKPSLAQKGDYEHTKAIMSRFIQEEMRKHNVPGLSIALVDDQRIVWAEGFGYADVVKRVSAKPETVYPVGSIAKLFTTLAILQLAEQNKIDIDKPLQTYLPEFSIKTRFSSDQPITPRTIMTHHSGLPSEHLKTLISRKPIPVTELMKELKEEYVAYPPNTIFSYSNLAFRLLGYVVERVSGQPFVSYMDESVLNPMGMTTASFALRPDLGPLLAKGYRGGKEAEEFLFREPPSPEGLLYASVIDLGRFIQIVFAQGRAGNEKILDPRTLGEMLTPQNNHVSLDFDFRIGLGWFLDDSDLKNAGPVASHGGALSLFFSQLILLPEHKLGVVVLANSSTALGVVNRVAEETLKLALEAKAGIKQPETDQAVPEVVLPWSQKALKDYTGYYATPARVYTITTRGGELYARLMGRPVRLIPHPNGLFSLQYRLWGLIPMNVRQLNGIHFSLADTEGRHTLILHQNGRRHLIGEKIEPTFIPESWLKRAGEYELVNASDYLPVIGKTSLSYESPFLMIDVSIPLLGEFGLERLRFALCPVSDHEAILLGLGRNMGETIHVITENGEERLLYSGLKFKKRPQ